MAGHEHQHRRNQSTPHAIPLQDLGRADGDRLAAPDSPATHRRTLSDRGRDLFQYSREALLQRDGQGVRYAPVPRGAQPQSRRGIGLGLALDTDIQDTETSRNEDHNGGLSAIGPGFQEAVGFSGLSYVDDQDGYLDGSPTRRATRSNLPTLRTVPVDDFDETRSLMDEEFDDGTGAFPHEDDADTIPLTDTSRTPSHSSPKGQRHDRSTPSKSGHAGFLTPARWDGTHDPEMGTLSPVMATTRSRSGSSLVPNSPLDAPLRRAGTILEKMSQRVVNLSNESEIVEKSIKRSPSTANVDLRDRSQPATPIQPAGLDGHASPHSPIVEKLPSPVRTSPLTGLPPAPTIKEPNPLRGRSLGLFGPENEVRRTLLEILTHPLIEPAILVMIVLQTVLLAGDAASNVYNNPRSRDWGHWSDYALLTLFSIYSVELAAKVIVSGFMINPVEYSTLNRNVRFGEAVLHKANNLFSLHRKVSDANQHHPKHGDHPQPLFRGFTTQNLDQGPGTARQAQRRRLARRAFLRHSFNRLDFIAVGAFWISFFVSVFGVESKQHLYVFRMLSCLRILRLLGITSGTLVILRSLKRAMPILLNVAFLISFFWLLFAIVGIQSFKSSLRRTCVWQDPNGVQPDYAQNTPGNFQFCGGWLAPNGSAMPYIQASGAQALEAAKGYWCPVNSKCIEGTGPYNGTVGFDNLPQSLEMVFVIMTSNTFSDVMYYLTNSDYLAAALFYAFGIVILTLWMVNLLIAVITSSFQIIREESKASAFAAEQTEDVPVLLEDPPQKTRSSALKRGFEKTHWLWIAVIALGLIAQAMKSVDMGDHRADLIGFTEVGVTLALDLEILLRLIVDWRNFVKYRRNMVDLALAISTSVLQIPVIHNSGKAYAWLSIFEILRVYRLVLSVKITKDLIMLVLGNFSGIANLILFVFLLTFLAAIFATQLLRGELPAQDINGNTLEVTFFTMWNAFLGMYQMLSSENWTAILYNVTQYQVGHNNGWIGAAFCILWYILANFVVLNMFIAVIQENFDVSEDEKRLQQVKAFLQQRKFVSTTSGMLSLSSIFKIGNARRQDPLDYGTHATEMLLKDAVVRDFLDDAAETPSLPPSQTPAMRGATGLATDDKTIGRIPGAGFWGRIQQKVFQGEANPFYGNLTIPAAERDLDPRQMARQVVQAATRRKEAQKAYLQAHPNYLTSLYIFKVDHPIRRVCQKIVGPGRGGDRVQGLLPSAPIWYAFSAFIYTAIVAMVLLACITTPLYQKEYFARHGYTRENWFVWTDTGFAILFTVEAIIKVIADGFFFTPNAYFRSSWGMIDGVVLISLWTNVITLLYDPGSGSRTVGAFKALRALRLLNISDSARDTFHSVIVVGGLKVVSAALVSISLLIPFAIYGLNLFSGQMQSCNDNNSGIVELTNCVNEYMSSPYEWNVLAPRVVANSYYSFDDFGSSLFILFQIVSQEGWIDVMWSGQSVTGIFTQPSAFASQENAIFFVVFNLLGAVFVLTLFVSVFMRNYTEQTGVAFLTTEQRSWLELRKLLRQVSPSKRPNPQKQRLSWQEWCYRKSVKKNGRWQRAITGLLVLHLVLLCLEWYPDNTQWLRIRDFIFLGLTLVFAANVIVRIVGLSWQRFRKSAWDCYAVVSISGTLITLIMVLAEVGLRNTVQVHKLFLVSITLLLIPRNNQLDQLFKTAAASLTSISNLLATWFVMFLVFAIALNQTFGLTRFANNENGNVNFRDIPKSLILLFRISVGEGWNQLMVDFASVEPPFCTIGDRYFDGDCGSREWARALFILWNILSMYIFVNLFVSLIYESFSYVYQRSSGLSVISREEIRRFKQAWAEHDPKGSGYISKEAFPRLLGELSGLFEMRIYDGDFTVSSVLDDCRINPKRLTGSSIARDSKYSGVDLDKLNARLAYLPVDEVRMRRNRMNTFYEEVLVSADPDKGIEFSTLLMILAHYKVINDNRSLRLEEFLRRRARLQRVDEAVRRQVVIGFFDTLHWSRKFRRHIQAKRHHSRMTTVPSHEYAVPEIFVQDETTEPLALSPSDAVPAPLTPVLQQPGEGHTPPHRSPSSLNVTPASSNKLSPHSNYVDASRSRSGSNASSVGNGSPTRRGGSASDSFQGSWHLSSALTQPFDPAAFRDDDDLLDAPVSPSARRNNSHRASSHSTGGLASLSPGGGGLSYQRPGANRTLSDDALVIGEADRQTRNRSATTVSNKNMLLDDLDNSVWGESIRRSFTTRRGGGPPPPPAYDHSRQGSRVSSTATAFTGRGPVAPASFNEQGGAQQHQWWEGGSRSAGVTPALGFVRGADATRNASEGDVVFPAVRNEHGAAMGPGFDDSEGNNGHSVQAQSPFRQLRSVLGSRRGGASARRGDSDDEIGRVADSRGTTLRDRSWSRSPSRSRSRARGVSDVRSRAQGGGRRSSDAGNGDGDRGRDGWL